MLSALLIELAKSTAIEVVQCGAYVTDGFLQVSFRMWLSAFQKAVHWQIESNSKLIICPADSSRSAGAVKG